MRTRVRRLALTTAGVLIGATALIASGATSASAATPTCFGKPATIVGTSGSNKITGTSRDDVIYGGAGNDVINGGAGNDLICGATGADTIRGGSGNDWIDGGLGTSTANDSLAGDSGNDFFSPGFDNRPGYDSPPDRITYYHARGPVKVDATTRTVTGADGTDTWLGNRAEIAGSRYGDTFVGGPRNDLFIGGDGADTMSGGGGDDLLWDDYPGSKRTNSDKLDGGPGADVINTVGGRDNVKGGDGDDHLTQLNLWSSYTDGGAGNDTIRSALANSASQSVIGGSGTDTVTLYTTFINRSWPWLTVDLTKGTAHMAGYGQFPFSGTENLFVRGAGTTWTGDEANNRIATDGTANLYAYGRGGNDVLVGSGANDRLNGDAGRDTAYPNGGSDRCVSIESVVGGRC